MIRIYRIVFLFLLLLISYAAVTPMEGGASVPYLDKIFHFSAFIILTFFWTFPQKEPFMLIRLH